LVLHAQAAAAVPAVAQGCRPLAAAVGAAGADCKAAGKQEQQQQQGEVAAVGAAARVLSSSNESSSSREWDMVGSFAAADALEQFEDPHPQYSQSQQQQQQQQRGQVFEVPLGAESDGEDSIEDFLASAPPAPTHLLHDYHASTTQQQQQQQQQMGHREEEEEMMYALEW
jgi:hypothetical protein